MPDKVQSFKVLCAGGLNSNEHHLELSEMSPGSASRLINYETSVYGGYRRIDGYQPFDSENPEVGPNVAEGPILGVMVFRNDGVGNPYLIATRKNAGENTYGFWRHVPLSGWERIPEAPTRTLQEQGYTVLRTRHVQFNFGGGSAVAFADGVNNLLIFDGIDWTEIDPSNNDQALARPAVVEEFENHIFVSGDPVNSAVVAHSSPSNALDWTAASGAGQITTGFSVVQIKPFRGDLFVFGENQIKSVTADFQAAFLITPVTTNVGCVARDSVLEIGGDLVFLAPDGIRPVAGTARIGDVELETISRDIRTRVLNIIDNTDLDTLVGLTVRSKSQLRYFFGGDSQPPAVSLGINGSLTRTGEGIGWEFGDLVGIRASCASSEYVGREEYVLHGDYDGVVYRQERGNSFNGENIISIYASPYLDFGDTQVRKVIDKLNTFVRPEGQFNLKISATYDYSDPLTENPASFDITSTGAPVVYNGDGIVYNGESVIYGGANRPVLEVDMYGSCYSARFTYVTDSQEASHTIQGFVVELIVAGRK